MRNATGRDEQKLPVLAADLVQKAPQVLHREDPVKRVGWGRFEAELVVEGACPLDRMGHHSAHSHRFGNSSTTQECVLQQRPANPLALVTAINRKPGENQDRHRPFRRLTLHQPLCRIVWSDLSDRESVVADDPPPITGDESARRTSGLGMPGATVEPVIEGLFLAAKITEVVLTPQRLGLRIGHDLLEDARRREELPQPLWDMRGPIE